MKLEIPLLGKFASNNQNCLFKLKSGTYTNLNMLTLMIMLVLSLWDREYSFWVNKYQKIKIVSFNWNLVHKLIRLCWIHVFCFRPEINFLGKFGKKIQNCLFKVKLGAYIYLNMLNSLRLFINFCFRLEMLFLIDPKLSKTLLKLFNLIVFSFCFGKSVRILADFTALQNFLLRNGTE